jgi:16S rRNA (adenine1518-N6/adenine1519-N6)-dimethyltransferase
MRPRKSLGQNFLKDGAIIHRIVDALDLTLQETVVEIGPGTGALTRELVVRAGDVFAIEFDRDLVPLLNEQFSGKDNFHLLNEDALNIDLSSILEDNTSAKLVANLPYNISTPILQRLIEQRHLFSTIVLMFQREVVERITAPPGGKERGFLSVLVESAFETEYLFDVPPDAFHPVPKVWSAVVRLKPKPALLDDEQNFRQLISRSFLQKRKTILNNLKAYIPNAIEVLEAAQIDPARRAETLTLVEWVDLTKQI